MKNKKRIVALIMAVIFFSLMLLFSFYIAKEINHDCVGDNCPICQEISICENILRNISNDIAINGFVFIYTYISYKIILLYNPIFSKITLVSLKVKLSN